MLWKRLLMKLSIRILSGDTDLEKFRNPIFKERKMVYLVRSELSGLLAKGSMVLGETLRQSSQRCIPHAPKRSDPN